MKITIERTKFEPNYIKGLPHSWDVAFEAETANGIKLYAPTVIYYKDVPQPVTECAVTLKAFMDIMPSQIQHIYKDTDVLTELDELAAEAFKATMELDEEERRQVELDQNHEQLKSDLRKQIEESRKQRDKLIEERLSARRADLDKFDEQNLKFSGGRPKNDAG